MIDWQYRAGDPTAADDLKAESADFDEIWRAAGFEVVQVRDWPGPPVPAEQIHGVSTDAIWARFMGRGGAGDTAREAADIVVRLWPLIADAFVTETVRSVLDDLKGPLKVGVAKLLHRRVRRVTIQVADDGQEPLRDDCFEFLPENVADLDRQVDAMTEVAADRIRVTERVTTTFSFDASRGQWIPQSMTQELLREYEEAIRERQQDTQG